MWGRVIRGLVAAGVGMALAGVALPAAGAAATECVPAVAGRCELWAATHDGPAGTTDLGRAMALSPDGARIFVGGTHTVEDTVVPFVEPYTEAGDFDFAVVSYEAATGGELWSATYGGPGDPSTGAADDYLEDIVVSADGRRVYVTGRSRDGGNHEWATVAFDAVTGKRLWASRYNGGSHWGSGYSIAIGSVGPADEAPRELVFVAGPLANWDGSVIAYDGKTGEEVWATLIEAWPSEPGEGIAVTAVPGEDGSRGGLVHVAASDVVASFDAATGEERWSAGYGGRGNYARDIVPAGGRVFVTGAAYDTGFDGPRAVTFAYDAATGKQFWQATYAGPDDVSSYGWALAVPAAGDRVFLCASGWTGRSGTAVTAAYDAASGAQLWAAPRGGLVPRTFCYDVAVDPAGTRVVTVEHRPFTTVNYDAATGAPVWEARYGIAVVPRGVLVAPDGSRGFIVGTERRDLTVGFRVGTADFLTVAYEL